MTDGAEALELGMIVPGDYVIDVSRPNAASRAAFLAYAFVSTELIAPELLPVVREARFTRGVCFPHFWVCPLREEGPQAPTTDPVPLASGERPRIRYAGSI